MEAPRDHSATIVIDFSSLNPCRIAEDLKAPNLKRLYSLLLQISLHPSFDVHCIDGTLSFDVLNSRCKVQVSRVDIMTLSELLFLQLHQHYDVVFSNYNCEKSNNNCEQTRQILNIITPLEDHIFLLKCCMIILPYLRFVDSLVSERSECLIRIFDKLCSLEMLSCRSQGATRNGHEINLSMFDSGALNGCSYSNLEAANSSICCPAYPASLDSYWCSTIEVFIDELLVNRHVRQCFKQLEGFPLSLVLEGISAHFLLYMSTDGTMDKFLHSLSCPYCAVSNFTVLSLTAAISMFSIPAIYAAPFLLQAHIILLASSSIRIHMSYDKKILVPLCFDSSIAALECSLHMFNFYMSSLKLDRYSNEVKTEMCLSSFAHDFWATGCQSIFHLYINSDTHDRVKDRIGGLVYSLETVSSGTSCTDKFDILSTSTSFIQNNKEILDESWRDDICMMLNRLIEHTISSAIPTDEKSKYGEVCQQELFLLAAVMKLMGCTLFRIVESMKQIRSIQGSQLLFDHARKKLDSVLKIVNLFGLYQMAQRIEEIIPDVKELNLPSCTEIIIIVMHFARLLVFASDCEHGSLFKCCIFLLMAVMNLLVFEEGNLDTIPSFLQHKSVSLSKVCSGKSKIGITCKQSSRRIASKFEKIRKMQVKGTTIPRKCINSAMTNETELGNNELQNGGITFSDEHEETWANGEAFFKSIGEKSDYSDLIDFVACKKEKDYSSWLKSRVKFRDWRCRKLATYREARTRRFLAKLFATSLYKKH